MKKTFLLIALVVTVLVLSFTRAVISNKISTSGLELSSINKDIKTYQTNNMILQEKINKLSSLTYLSEEAAKKGFTETKSVFAVSSSRPLALKQ